MQRGKSAAALSGLAFDNSDARATPAQTGESSLVNPGLNDAWNKLAEIEAAALATLLATDDRKVLVFVAAVRGEEAVIVRGVSGPTTRGDVDGFIQAIERERDLLAAYLRPSPNDGNE